jgi:hypothetical protein
MPATSPVRRQSNLSEPQSRCDLAPGRPEHGGGCTYQVDDVSRTCRSSRCSTCSTSRLNAKGEEPIAFDSDCREGICGMCGLMINGRRTARRTTTCQLHMRSFKDGDTITVEPWRADAFPVIKDLVVDRSGFDRIIQAGGFISVNTGSAPEATRCRCRSEGRPRLRGGRPASAAAPASPPARTPRRCSSWAPRSPTSASCRRASPSAGPGSSRWSPSTTTRASAAAPTSAPAPTRAPRRSRWTSSPAQQGPGHSQERWSLSRA